MNITNAQQGREMIEQLKREKNNNRINVSQTVNDLIRYVQEYQKDDYLLTGFSTEKSNPYRPKSNFQCLIL